MQQLTTAPLTGVLLCSAASNVPAPAVKRAVALTLDGYILQLALNLAPMYTHTQLIASAEPHPKTQVANGPTESQPPAASAQPGADAAAGMAGQPNSAATIQVEQDPLHWLPATPAALSLCMQAFDAALIYKPNGYPGRDVLQVTDMLPPFPRCSLPFAAILLC